MADIIELKCPYCHANLWIDTESKNIIDHKKSLKKNFSSFDDLLNKEKEKKQKVDERFILAKKLEKAKKKKAEELFNRSLEDKKV